MFYVFDKHLLTDMGKTIVRKYVHTTDAQSVWKDFQDHMKSSSKGPSEKRRLTQYVTNTTLDDNYKGTTEQFVLHFNEQFRQLEEMKMNPIKPIIQVKTNEELDKEEGESIIDEEESTETSQELSEEQNSTSDIYIEDQEDSKSIETSQVYNVLNNSIPNEVDSHTMEDVTEIELLKVNGEQNNAKEDKLLTTNFEV